MINLDAMKTVMQEETDVLRYRLREAMKEIEELKNDKRALSEEVKNLKEAQKQGGFSDELHN